MLQHSLLLIYRNFIRFKSTFVINLIGLSTGLACALLIFLWVKQELAMDSFHEQAKQLYQVMTNHHNASGTVTWEVGPGLLGEALQADMPEIKYAVSSSDIPEKFTVSGSEKHISAAGQFVSKDYFNIFSYQLLHGAKGQVLSNRNGIVISEELALKLFNTTQDVVGKTMQWQILHFKKPVIVTGIFQTMPSTASERYDFFLSFEEFKSMLGSAMHWDNHQAKTYLLLESGVDVEQFNRKLSGFLKTKTPDSNVALFVRPYADKYLYNKYENGVQAGGRIEYVQLFSLIAIFILIIACINFMNLSTAKASRRVKEVGIKKAMGASRRSLILQYLGESMLVAFASLIVALMLVELLVGPFSRLTGMQLSLSYHPLFILGALSLTLFTGLLAGSYPALYLSGFSPATVLRGKLDAFAGELWARKGLVVFQFALSVVLIISVMVVFRQIAYVQTKNLGYSKENIIYFTAEGNVQEKLEAFLDELEKTPGVKSASSGGSILSDYGSTVGLTWPGANPDQAIAFQTLPVNYGMIETLSIKIKAGRSFSREFGADSASIVFNESAIQAMGLQEPIGKVVNVWGENKMIIGVVKDFHFQTLHEKVKPLFFRLEPKPALKVMAKIDAGREKETVENIQALYNRFNPGFVLDYKFLDEAYQALYTSEQRVADLAKYFACLAILISCLGLFGLAAFTAERRKKEIGVRKVLGASEWSIVYLITSDFTKLVLVSVALALPISYFLAANWLENFAYRVELEPWYFMSGGFAALLIAWLTVSTQAFKASKLNPTDCLQNV
ncbi:ABC transporter permease [Pontibacter oryzae]|uniref:ABC transporter permease n=1 Tax=Pontibacter oryzae TaxID=2304593 RepID=A0A399SDY3_9BACT|nr:FtsX-like permease family protein [Pontibacter oryzae]RIJ41890.1 ABC transporter permease [Pontibacter oryzae]